MIRLDSRYADDIVIYTANMKTALPSEYHGGNKIHFKKIKVPISGFHNDVIEEPFWFLK